MPWWGWLAVGVALLMVEVLVQTEFWLACLGGAALLVAGLARLGLVDPVWVQWAAFAGLSVVLAGFVRRQLHEKIVGKAPGLAPELVGEKATVQEEIAPGADGRVTLRGSPWRATNVGTGALAAGEAALVERVDGVVLEVRAAVSPELNELEEPWNP